jgi:hypothetical protein
MTAVVCPGANVSGVVIPLTLKPLAFIATCETVKGILPLLLIVTVFELELPAFMFEKLTLAGLGDNTAEAAVPVPVSDNTLGELDAFDAMLTVPARLPAVVGAKSTLNVTLAPAGIVAGAARPLTV